MQSSFYDTVMVFIFFQITDSANRPVPQPESGIIGRTSEDIIERFPDYTVLPFLGDMFLVEIRIEKSTLTCVMKNNTCIEVYEFSD